MTYGAGPVADLLAFVGIDGATMRGALTALFGAVVGALASSIPAGLSARSARKSAAATVRRAEKFAAYEAAFGHVIESAEIAVHLWGNLISARSLNTAEQFSLWQKDEFPKLKAVADAMTVARQRLRVVGDPRVLGLYDAHMNLFEPLGSGLYDGELDEDFARIRSELLDDSRDALGLSIRQDLGYAD